VFLLFFLKNLLKYQKKKKKKKKKFENDNYQRVLKGVFNWYSIDIYLFIIYFYLVSIVCLLTLFLNILMNQLQQVIWMWMMIINIVIFKINTNDKIFIFVL